MSDLPSELSADFEVLADELWDLLATGRQVTPLSERSSTIDLPTAYRIAEAIRSRRCRIGESVMGRKIGFTNRKMWQAYEVKAPIWGYMYDSSVHDLRNGSSDVSLVGLPEPKIEPEIVLGLGVAPEPGMNERALLDCVEWIALGFEVVQSVYPGWRFDAADAISAYGLHAALHIGPRQEAARNRANWLERLPSFEVSLSCDTVEVARGKGSDVLGGPLAALRHLNDLLADGHSGPPLSAGEIITTGTLALAAAVEPGQSWRASPVGIDLSEIELRFVDRAD